MIDWLKRKFGRGSRLDRLVRALPNPDEILRRTRAWSMVTLEYGDQIAAWEAEESKLVDVIRGIADASDVLSPFIDGVVGDDKRQALQMQLRAVALSIGLADDAFDLFWEHKARPILEAYIARVRGR